LIITTWICYYSPKPQNQSITTVFVILFIAFCTYKSTRIFQEIRQLKLALDCELAVGQFLELKRSQGAQVFHPLLQALIELAAEGSEERSILESISNHIGAAATRAPYQSRLIGN
jgi:hypothetical protein